MQQLSRNLRQVEPVVQHGIQELRGGTPVDHTLRQIAIMASLVGAGVPVNQAIQAVERVESQLLGPGVYEPTEPTYHPGYGAGGMAGKAVPGYGKAVPGMAGKAVPGYGKAGMAVPGVAGKAVPGYGKAGMAVPGVTGKAVPGYGKAGMAVPGVAGKALPGYGKAGMAAPGVAGKALPGLAPMGKAWGGQPMPLLMPIASQ